MEPLESAVLQAREEDADLIGLEFDHAEVHMLDLSDLEFPARSASAPAGFPIAAFPARLSRTVFWRTALLTGAPSKRVSGGSVPFAKASWRASTCGKAACTPARWTDASCATPISPNAP